MGVASFRPRSFPRVNQVDFPRDREALLFPEFPQLRGDFPDHRRTRGRIHRGDSGPVRRSLRVLQEPVLGRFHAAWKHHRLNLDLAERTANCSRRPLATRSPGRLERHTPAPRRASPCGGRDLPPCRTARLAEPQDAPRCRCRRRRRALSRLRAIERVQAGASRRVHARSVPCNARIRRARYRQTAMAVVPRRLLQLRSCIAFPISCPRVPLGHLWAITI
jgi:hypothetical protein